MNAGKRPLILLSSTLLGIALSGCAQLPTEPTKAEPRPPAEVTMPSPPPIAPVEPPRSAQGNTNTVQWTPPPSVIRPGECWVQAVIQPRPVSKPLEIVVRDAVNDIEITPPTLETTRKEIIVREGGQTFRIEPPVYKRITEKVMVRPEIRRSVVVPAVFEEREVTIEIEAERTVLERCKVATVRRSTDAPVQALCARHIPAKTQNVKRKILIQPETTREVVEPAVYKDVTRWVIETPARAIPVDIPPRTASLKVREITRPEQIEEQQLPAEIKRLITTAYEGEPSMVLRRAVCDQELSPSLIQSLQVALKQAGFDAGTADGKFGRQTSKALLDYQRHHGLAQGALTYETLEHLGVSVAP